MEPSILVKNMRNFHFAGSEDDLGLPSGAVGRIRANLAAYYLLRYLESENRAATPREQVVLARWSGWGSVSQALDNSKAEEHRKAMENPNAGYYEGYAAKTWFQQWGPHYWSIRRALTDDEFKAAQAMTVDAFYTPSFVVRATWEAARRMGFSGGRVLEPGGGIGNFFTYAPRDMASRCQFHAVEMDNISARILRFIHPQARVTAGDFTKSDLPTESYDMVIGNVPFGQTPVPDLSFPNSFNTHNYFLAKASRLLAPGGLCCVLTSRYTMDAYAAAHSRQREFLAEQYDLVGAVRFPGGTFQRTAGTEALEDLLFLRKKDPKNPLPETAIRNWDLTRRIEVPDESRYGAKPETVIVNEYFADHPEAVLGRQVTGRGQHAEGQYMVRPEDTINPGEAVAPGGRMLVDRLNERIATLPEGVFVPRARRGADGRDSEGRETARGEGVSFALNLDGNEEYLEPEDPALPGEYIERRGSVYQVEGRRLIAFKGKGKSERLALDYVALKSLVRRQIALEKGPDSPEVETHRKTLRDTFNKFTARNGSPRRNPDPLRVVKDDPCIDLVRELEISLPSRREDGSISVRLEPAPILTKRVIALNREPDRAESPEDAVRLSVAYRNGLDMDYIAKLLGVENTDVGAVGAMKTRLRRVEDVFEEPGTGKLQTAVEFFSGNLRAKLRACEDAEGAAADQGEEGRYARHIGRLQEVMPPWEPFESITVPFAARWVPEDLYSQFLTELLGGANAKVTVRLTQNDSFSIGAHPEVTRGERNRSMFGRGDMDWTAIKIAETLLALKPLKVMKEVPKPGGDPGETMKVLDATKTEELQVAGNKIKDEWQQFLGRHEEARQRCENTYNEVLNNEMRISHMEGQTAVFPEMNSAVQLRPAQRSGICKGLRKMAGMLDHDTGYGKTFTQIAIGIESKRLGLANKPIIGTLNDTHEQFAEAARLLYPGARVLAFNAATDNGSAGRRRFLTRAAFGDWDLVLVPHSQLSLISNNASTVHRYFDGMLSSMDSAIQDAKARGEDRTSLKNTVRMRKNMAAMMDGLMEKLKAKQGKEVFWEDCGFDLFLLDEAHIAKRAPFQTVMQAKGLDTSFSLRGLSILLKNISIQEKRDGQGVIYATATPLSNTLAEFWNMSRQCEPKKMKQMGFERFDAWAATYCESTVAPELNEANNQWRMVERLSRYRNVRSLQSLLRSIFDVRKDPKEAGLKLPECEGGKVQNILVPMIPQVQALQEKMARVYKNWEEDACRAEMPHVPLVLMGYGAALGTDPRLVDATIGDVPGTLARKAAERIAHHLEKHKDQNGMVLVCVDRFHTMRTTTIDNLDDMRSSYSQAEQAEEGEDALPSVVNDADDAENAAEAADENASMTETVLDETDVVDAVALDATVVTTEAAPRKPFNLVHEMMRMVQEEYGYSSREMASLLDVKNGKERKELLDRTKLGGDLRVMFISSSKGGVGINVSARCCALVELGPPKDLTPKSARQVRGRIFRDPNIFGMVAHERLAMEGTVIAGHYHRIQRKDEAITQIETGIDCDQQMEDPVSELSLSASEMKALILNDDRILRQTELKDQVRKLEADVRAHATRKKQLRDSLRTRTEQQAREELTLELQTSAKPRVDEALAKHRNAEGKKLVPTIRVTDVTGQKVTTIPGEKVEEWLNDSMEYLGRQANTSPSGTASKLMLVGELPVELSAQIQGLGDGSASIGFALLANQDGPAHTRKRYLSKGRPSNGKGAIQIWHAFKTSLDNEITAQTRYVTSGRADVERLTVEVSDTTPHPKAKELAALQGELNALENELRREGKIAGAVTAVEVPVEMQVNPDEEGIALPPPVEPEEEVISGTVATAPTRGMSR